MWWSSACHLVVEWRSWVLSGTASGGIFTSARCASRSTHPDQNSGEVAVDLSWSHQTIRSGMLPWKADVADERAGHPRATGLHDGTRPAVGEVGRVTGRAADAGQAVCSGR
jgi:hypothetical protein